MRINAPYQIFFPIGILNAMLAVGIWFVQNLNWFSTPAIFIHAKLIVGGFLWSFITGFLMTAIPRMTDTKSANVVEYMSSLFLICSLTIFSWKLDGRFFYFTQILLITFLLTYGARRILKAKKTIPVFFSHVGLAMALALVGSYYHYIGNSYMGIHLLHAGATLLLILGIGTRFFSFLSGLSSDFEENNKTWHKYIFHTLGILVSVSLFLAGSGMSIAYLSLAIFSLVYLFFIWKIYRSSNRPSALKHGVRIVAAAIPISFFLTWLEPGLYITWFHILFISCFSLITFSVATRVILAHGAYPTDLEMNSTALKYLVLFLFLGTISRILYAYTDGLWKTSCLHLAATLWFLAIICWGYAFFIKIFKPGPQSKPSC
ncbi:MAG: NnrS family protein [Oligoflexia bacterium]|nr:NnrS family protein [Oligoflexia bacterium]